MCRSRTDAVCLHLDFKCGLNHIRAHHRHRKAGHPPTAQKNLRGTQARLRLLRRPYTHLVESAILHNRDILGDLRMYATREDLEPIDPRSLHWYRE